MTSMPLQITILILHLFHFQRGMSDCTFRTTADMGKDSPLILSPDGSFIAPKRQTDILLFQHGQKVLLACPGKRNTFVIQGTTQPYNEVNATCGQNNSFSLGGGVSSHFRHVTCARTPDSSILDAREDCGSKGHKKLLVGFQLPVTRRFVKTFEVCYDPLRHATLYSKFQVSKGVKNGQNIPRTSYFKTEVFRGNLKTNFASIYRGQEGRLRTLLGRDYIQCSSEAPTCLQKGHLAAFGHFPFYSQQEATMYAINTAPQWGKVNMGDWKRVEDRIRSLAADSDQDLNVVVGTFGVLKLKSTAKRNIQIFLATNGKTPVVPVPELFYALVYDQSMTHGFAVLVLNDAEKRPNPRKICRDVCNSWGDRAKGFLYCCSLRDFNLKTGLAFPDKPLLAL